MEVSISISKSAIKIYIDDVLHLIFKQEELIGVQSWVAGDGDKVRKYYIEYYTKTQTILTEYDEQEKWYKILKKLDDENLFIERFN
jgi:hypothetical protein